VQKRPGILLLLAIAIIVAGCGSSSGSGSKNASTTTTAPNYLDQTGTRVVTITARDDIFTPQFVKVRKGTTVIFENNGRNEHNVVSADGAFKDITTAAFEPGAQARVTLTTTGTHNYFCSLHGTATNGMRGAFLVVP